MQGCVISCGTVVFFQKSRNLSRSLLTSNNFYCAYEAPFLELFLISPTVPFELSSKAKLATVFEIENQPVGSSISG